MTGKKDGVGESVVVFPDGLACTSHMDEATGMIATVKNKKMIFDGNEEWEMQYAGAFYLRSVQGLTDDTQKPVCNYYVGQTGANGFPNDMCCKLLGINFGFTIADPRYTTLSEFTEHLSSLYQAGTPLEVIYPIATPEHYVLDEPLTLTYKVDGLGTERSLPEDTSSVVTAPFRADIKYALNSLDVADKMDIISANNKPQVILTESGFTGVTGTGKVVDALVLKTVIEDNELNTAAAINELYNKVDENEYLTAQAITQLESRIKELETANDLYTKVDENEYLTTQAITQLESRIRELETALAGVEEILANI